MERIALGKALKHACLVAWKHKGMLLVVYFILLIVEVANFFLKLSFSTAIAFGLFGIYCALFKTKLLLAFHDGTSYAWNKVAPSFDNFISYLALVMGLGVLVLPLILFPGAVFARYMVIKTLVGIVAIVTLLVLYLRYVFILPIVVDKKYGPLQALRCSATRTKGRLLHLFFLMFIFDFQFFLRMLVNYTHMSPLRQDELARSVGMPPMFVSLGVQKMVTLGAILAWFTIVPVAALTFVHVYRSLEPNKR